MQNHLIKKIALFLMILFGGAAMTYGQSAGNTKEMDKKVSFVQQLQILEILKGENETSQKQILQQISENPNAYIPPVLHRYAGALFNEGKSNEGWFWHFIAELRGRIDANLTSYEKAMQFVSFITNMNAAMIRPENNFENLDQLEQTVKTVVHYVRIIPVSYQRNWIVLLKFKAEPAGGQEADMKIQLMKPKSKWDKIKQKTIDEYYHNFQKYVKKAKEGDLKIGVTAVPFNYTPYEIGRIQVNDKRILGVLSPADKHGPGGGGGSHAGLLFEAGPATIKWMIGGVVGEDSNAGEYRTAEGVIPEPPEEAKNWKTIYLGVYIYPDTVKFTLSDDYPSSLEQ